MYNEFFGLEQNPFAAKPDPAFFYHGQQHDASLRSLMFAVQARMGLVSLTGEEGTGKSTVMERLRDSLESDNIHCAFLRESRISTSRFFQTIASDLNLRCQATSAYQVFSAMHQFMLQEAQKGRTVALLVDDAHHLPADVFKEILHLASLRDDKTKLLQTVVAGRLELHPTLDALNLERLEQRGILRCTLHPFSARETKEYIEFRLARAGMPQPEVFSPQAIAEIYDRSRGFAPAIHVLCEALLLATFSANSKVCTQEILDQVFRKQPGKKPQIGEAAATVIDLAPSAPEMPPPEIPPMMTALLRLAFAPRPGSPPLTAVMSHGLDPQWAALQAVLARRNVALRDAKLVLGSKQPMRLAGGASPASGSRRNVRPGGFSTPPPTVHLAVEHRSVTALPVIKRVGKLVPLAWLPERSGRPVAAAGLRNVLLAPIPFAASSLLHPRVAASVGFKTVLRIPKTQIVPVKRPATAPGTMPVSAPSGAHLHSMPSIPRPVHPAAQLTPARSSKAPRAPVTQFQPASCDPHSPASSESVEIHSANIENPVTLAIADLREPSVREQSKPLPMAGSVRPSAPAAGMGIRALSNVLPPLAARCPSSKLEPADPRSSFLLLSAPPAAIAAHKRFPYQKWLLNLAIPILAGIALYGAVPAAHVTANVVQQGWRGAHRALVDRAAVSLKEDFRTGLDDWMNRAGARPSWASDAAGFVRPGALALYRPSLSLSDYQMQFLGTIDKKGLSWVVRAADFNNYYAIGLTVLKPGPVPAMGVTRYAVVRGKAQNPVTTPLLMSARPDTVYRVSLDVRGDRYDLSVQGRPAASWSEPALRHGGIGFFSEQDAGGRVASVQVRGQHDLLGRLFAFLLPAGASSYRESLNERAATALIAQMKSIRFDPYGPRQGYPSRSERIAAPPLLPADWRDEELRIWRAQHCTSLTSASPAKRGAPRTRHALPAARGGFSCY